MHQFLLFWLETCQALNFGAKANNPARRLSGRFENISFAGSEFATKILDLRPIGIQQGLLMVGSG